MKKGRTFNKSGFTLGELLIVFAIVFIIILLMLPIIRYANYRTDKVTCLNNVRSLGLAMYIYAKENEGKFPEKIKVLYDEEYLADKKLVDCPASKNIGTPESPDYIYTTGLSIKESSGKILVKDKKGNHLSRGGSVLFVNGTVLWEE